MQVGMAVCSCEHSSPLCSATDSYCLDKAAIQEAGGLAFAASQATAAVRMLPCAGHLVQVTAAQASPEPCVALLRHV